MGSPTDELEPYAIRPIGFVRSTLRAVADAPNQASEGAPAAMLEIDPAFAEALHLLAAGDEIVVVTWLHLADRSVLRTHPRGDPAIPLTGVFRTRSSQRPNPIGIHPVTVTAVEGMRVHVDALEAIDGTPVLDVKIALGERAQR